MSFSIASLVSLPPATRALTLTLIGLSTLLFCLRLSLNPRDIKTLFGAVHGDDSTAFPWLVLVPGSVGWYPWTLITSAFVESNLIEFIVSLLTLPLAGRYLERVWGQLELLKFVGVVVVASNIMTVGLCIIEGVALGDPATFLYGASYHGLMALQTGFLVAFTQIIPEHQVQFMGVVKMRVKSLPMLYVTISNIACIIGYQSPWFLIQAGWLVSWFYLRFVKMNEGGEFRGDRSETFAFASWFPPFVQKYVAQASKVVFNQAVRLHLLRPWTDIESGIPLGAGVPGGARAEAERRRAMALKALDQRMASKPTAPTSPTASKQQPSAPAMAPSGSAGAGDVAPAATASISTESATKE